MNNVGDGPAVSVVIPTYNRAEQLYRVLPSYLSSDVVLEVIIVDDGGSDNLSELVQDMAKTEPRLRYLRNEQNRGAPASRNRGMQYAEGKWVLQGEDDLGLGERCVEILLDHAEVTKADIIAGRRIWMRLGESQEQALSRANRSRHPPFNVSRMDVNSHATADDDLEVLLLDATMLISREVFERVQYDPAYGGPSSWREESDFQLKAQKAGFRLVFCPHALCFHYSRASQSFGRRRLRGTAVYAGRVFRNNLRFLRSHQAYLRAHYPRALVLGSPLASALIYGGYRTVWLVAAEMVRCWRGRKHDAFSWE